jgi:hypothetical protein
VERPMRDDWFARRIGAHADRVRRRFELVDAEDRTRPTHIGRRFTMSRWENAGELMRDHQLMALFVASHLGPKPRRHAERDQIIKRAAETLLAATSEEAAAARRIVATEYTAWSDSAVGRIRGRPTKAQWEHAIQIVDAATDEDIRNRVRGGMILQAAWFWREQEEARGTATPGAKGSSMSSVGSSPRPRNVSPTDGEGKVNDKGTPKPLRAERRTVRVEELAGGPTAPGLPVAEREGSTSTGSNAVGVGLSSTSIHGRRADTATAPITARSAARERRCSIGAPPSTSRTTSGSIPARRSTAFALGPGGASWTTATSPRVVDGPRDVQVQGTSRMQN